MFDFLFGWRKASKCKRLIKRVQCRLKVLKNKRSTVVRQSRDDVAELLKHGHGRTAFDRVEQIFKDECLLAVYDMLDKFCEFILSNLYYIRRNKDCPNDINEAVSSLIFASARFGDLPELISIRKLFGERYGQRFATVALELLPGNLVNGQMQEKMCIKSVSEDEKSRLFEEIIKSSLQSGPLLLEYSSELQQKLENDSSLDPIPGSETPNKADDGGKLLVSNTQKEETSQSDTEKSDLGQMERSLVVYDFALRNAEESAIADTSSESSLQLPEEMVYLDDIQELESPLSKENSFTDQRLFKFRSSAVPIRGKLDESKGDALDPGEEEQDLQDQKSAATRSFRKNRNNASAKRLKRRSVSGDATTTATATSINDLECAIYYGESCQSSPNHDRKNQHKKIPLKQQTKTYYIQEVPIESPSCTKVKSEKTHKACSLEHPCYTCTYNEKQEWDHTPQGPTIRLKLSRCCCSCRRNCQIIEAERGMVLNQKKTKDYYEDPCRSPTLLISTCSGSSSSSSPSIEEKPSYLRAMTMPPERPKDATVDGMLRSNSFPFREEHDGLSSNGHVHPKLPDYDELAARFIALKKANLQVQK